MSAADNPHLKETQWPALENAGEKKSSRRGQEGVRGKTTLHNIQGHLRDIQVKLTPSWEMLLRMRECGVT